MLIGAHGNGGGSYFNGKLDSVRFYANVPPTQDGVTNDFTEQVPQLGLAMTNTQWEVANQPEGTFFKEGLNVPLAHRLGTPLRIRFSIQNGGQ